MALIDVEKVHARIAQEGVGPLTTRTLQNMRKRGEFPEPTIIAGRAYWSADAIEAVIEGWRQKARHVVAA